MIEMMKSINFNQKTVVDFGTGTGVLAILAENVVRLKLLL
jgi:ribosomal protein L11 methyltransferase